MVDLKVFDVNGLHVLRVAAPAAHAEPNVHPSVTIRA
jgi:hypothetical protein